MLIFQPIGVEKFATILILQFPALPKIKLLLEEWGDHTVIKVLACGKAREVFGKVLSSSSCMMMGNII